MNREQNHTCIHCYDDYVMWKPNHDAPPEMMMSYSRFHEIWDKFIGSPASRAFFDQLKRVGPNRAWSTDSELAAGFLMSIQFHTRLTWNKESDALLNAYIREQANNDPSYFSWELEVKTPSDLVLAKAWLEAYYYNMGFLVPAHRVEFSSTVWDDRAGRPMLIIIKVPKRALFGAAEDPQVADIWDLSRVTAIRGSTIDCSVEYCGKSITLRAY